MLIFADGFDHYSTAAMMLNGAYAEMNASPSTAQPRNGAYCLQFTGDSFTHWARRVLGEEKPVLGFAFACYISGSLPASGAKSFVTGEDIDGNVLWRLSQTNDGRLTFYRGNTTTLLATSDQILLVGAYQFIEIMVKTDDAAGWVEVRVDGITVIDISALDTNGGAAGKLPTQVRFGQAGNAGLMYYDDVVCWDDQGDYFNDFPGDHRVRLAALDGDTAQADWVRNAGTTDYGRLIEIPADGDTSYIEAAEPYLASEFTFADVPDDVGFISGVYLVNMARKTASSPCNVQLSLVSGSSEGLGADNPMTQLYTYRGDPIVVDPNTGAPFEPSALNDTTLKITRTA